MKTTLDLPDELMRSIKVKAAREDRKLKDVVAELLRKGIEDDATPRERHRVKFPLISGGHPAAAGEEMTPERIADILLQQEVDWVQGRE